MKKNKPNRLLRAIGEADARFVQEAAGAKADAPFSKRRRLGVIAASVALFLLVFNLVLFIPFNTDPPDVSRYQSSAYYPIIEKLNAALYQKPAYKNNFQKGLAAIDSFLSHFGANGGDMAERPSGSGASSANPNTAYEEITDNQVEGVIEADLIKRSREYVYYFNPDGLAVYALDGENTALVGRYTLPVDDLILPLSYKRALYLSADCRTVTLLYHYAEKYKGSFLKVVSLDVSDPTAITEKGSLSITGEYNTSRLVDGKLLLLTDFYVGREPDFSDEETFLPQIITPNGKESIPLESIITPDSLTDTRYTVVMCLDEDTLHIEDCAAFLSYSQEIFVSQTTLYATRTFYEKTEKDSLIESTAMTEIAALSYQGNAFAHLGKITVAGYVKDQYSLDERNGTLRVVTTTDTRRYRENLYGDRIAVSWEIPQESTTLVTDTLSSASLYVIDLDTFQTIASVENFAPIGEAVRSVRFDQDSAYVCTAVALTDPVFFFDLSDLSHITYKDTGTIEGFSTSLIHLGNGFLLGIGVGSTRSLKIEVYEETDQGVRSVDVYEAEAFGYSEDYKSYYIDRENGYIGLGVTDYNFYTDSSEKHRYLLLQFNNYSLNVLADTVLIGDNAEKRGFVLDDFLYLFTDGSCKVVKLGERDPAAS